MDPRKDSIVTGENRWSRRSLLLLATSAIVTTAFIARSNARDEGRAVPPPEVDAASTAKSETAVLAGGCFWGVQGVYQHLDGVANAVSGYAGGEKATARYEAISSGATGHAEAVQITFDPRRISFGQILQVFFSVAHDPTQLNRQGPDRGTQYRSAIFPASAEQERVAKAYIAQLSKAGTFRSAIVTTLESKRAFYPAEDYHQDYMTRHPGNPYIMMHDLPKIKDLSRYFPDRYRAKPVLVADAGGK